MLGVLWADSGPTSEIPWPLEPTPQLLELEASFESPLIKSPLNW